MAQYIDGFAFPIAKDQLDAYQPIAESVAKIWREHGALDYLEFVGDDLKLEGTRSFTVSLSARENEAVVFGWVVFDSRETRDKVNQKVAADPRMAGLIEPLLGPENPIFDAQRMAYGGFRSFVQ